MSSPDMKVVQGRSAVPMNVVLITMGCKASHWVVDCIKEAVLWVFFSCIPGCKQRIMEEDCQIDGPFMPVSAWFRMVHKHLAHQYVNPLLPFQHQIFLSDRGKVICLGCSSWNLSALAVLVAGF